LNKHLNDVNMTYKEHFFFSVTMLGEGISVGLTLLIHAVFPWLFTNNFSNWIESCSRKLKKAKRK
jgi:hypothetical protein